MIKKTLIMGVGLLLMASLATALFSNGADHVGVSGTVDSTGIGPFDYFMAINDGANKCSIQFYYGGSLSGSATTIPSGGAFNKHLTQRANGYRIVASSGATDLYVNYE